MKPRYSAPRAAVSFPAGAALVLLAAALPSAPSGDGPPRWAYPPNPNGFPAPPADDGTVLHVPGSSIAFTLSQTHDQFAVADWHPDRHPPMPDVVARGRKPHVPACGYCHLPNGQGRTENAALAGLSSAYIVQQVKEIRDGRRRGAQPEFLAVKSMVEGAEHVSGPHLAEAADYFAALSYGPWIRVVESATVPRTTVGLSVLERDPLGGTEPIGDRVIELPEDPKLTALRDDASGFVAYVPPGSVEAGERLADGTGGGLACSSCHGPDLKGALGIPPLAGRSPSMLFRQLYDMKHGSRSGPSVAAMMPVVQALTAADMRDLAAYLASRQP